MQYFQITVDHKVKTGKSDITGKGTTVCFHLLAKSRHTSELLGPSSSLKDVH